MIPLKCLKNSASTNKLSQDFVEYLPGTGGNFNCHFRIFLHKNHVRKIYRYIMTRGHLMKNLFMGGTLVIPKNPILIIITIYYMNILS